MNYIKILLMLIISVSISSCQDTSKPTEADTTDLPGWKLVWSDEFNYTGLPDPRKWSYDVGDNGWGNNEKQYYSAFRLENARVEDGKLIIEAKRDFYLNHEYTSARLVTANKGDWTYGRFEIKAKLPSGRGTWPAIWMLPTDWSLGNKGWPDNGEIDIMEHVGYDPGVIHGSIHTNKYNWVDNTGKTATLKILDATTSFHTYALEWDSTEIKIYVDDINYFTFNNERKGWEYWPFFKDFHLLLNIAIGGNWGGAQGIDNSIFPQKMEVDYVRVYKKI
ncbi:family 16 glycosylhydrolase [Melioribacteraceae bacterium 4301-Me]|uniref:glycoside hydrolase family 16 protein n=1 Tax=Pyranulibacter aquaticus TaxID=3163344 RepID=UPI0035985E1A